MKDLEIKEPINKADIILGIFVFTTIGLVILTCTGLMSEKGLDDLFNIVKLGTVTAILVTVLFGLIKGK